MAAKKGATQEGVPEKKAKTDWESIERDYRAGVLSIREIAKMHGISDGAIRKKAKENKWLRDLTSKVNAKVRSDLVRTEVRTTDAQTERVIVEVAAAQVVQIVREHRASIKRMNALALSLLEELDEQTINRDLYADLGEMLRSEDDKGQDKRNDLYNKIISSANRVDSMKKLAETLRILIGLERQAFNISIVEDDLGEKPATSQDVKDGFAGMRAAFEKRLAKSAG